MEPTLALLVANLSGKARRVTWNGKEWLVAPATILVEGVLNGSDGPLFYPNEEIAKDYFAWNGMPIVVYHPTEPVTNKPISARSPKVLDKQGIGYVFEANHNDKLTVEAWFDIEATRRVDGRILSSLETGQPIELSTGLFTTNEPTKGIHNGIEYVAIARNYRPDHLAVLPDQKGACSLKDGCGVLVNKESKDSSPKKKSSMKKFFAKLLINSLFGNEQPLQAR
jgi:hypothetical protein